MQGRWKATILPYLTAGTKLLIEPHNPVTMGTVLTRGLRKGDMCGLEGFNSANSHVVGVP